MLTLKDMIAGSWLWERNFEIRCKPCDRKAKWCKLEKSSGESRAGNVGSSVNARLDNAGM